MVELKPDDWLIHKAGRGWYRPNAQGYTLDPAQAGRYTHEKALSYSHPNGLDGPRDGMTIKHESEVPGAIARPPTQGEELVERVAKAIFEAEPCPPGMEVVFGWEAQKSLNGPDWVVWDKARAALSAIGDPVGGVVAGIVSDVKAYAKELEEFHSTAPSFVNGAAEMIEQKWGTKP